MFSIQRFLIFFPHLSCNGFVYHVRFSNLESCLSVIIEKFVVNGCGFALSDLVPREAVEKWLKYLREELPTVAFKCSTQEQKSNLGWKSGPKAGKGGKAGKTGNNSSNLLQTSDCLGAETLIKLLKNYSRSHEVIENLKVELFA